MTVSSAVQELLSNPNFEPSEHARADLESGKVDPRLVAVLGVLAQKHQIEVSIIKTGHPMGPTTPSGKANSHYYYRAADIPAVDGKLVAGNARDSDLLDVGRLLRGMTPHKRPDRIMGPAGWQNALGYAGSEGFVNDAFHNEIHADHLHVGFDTEVKQ